MTKKISGSTYLWYCPNTSCNPQEASCGKRYDPDERPGNCHCCQVTLALRPCHCPECRGDATAETRRERALAMMASVPSGNPW